MPDLATRIMASSNLSMIVLAAVSELLIREILSNIRTKILYCLLNEVVAVFNIEVQRNVGSLLVVIIDRSIPYETLTVSR